jgi:hypothetical protein
MADTQTPDRFQVERGGLMGVPFDAATLLSRLHQCTVEECGIEM